MHVAGSDTVGYGVGMAWYQDTRILISNLLDYLSSLSIPIVLFLESSTILLALRLLYPPNTLFFP